MTFYCPHSPPDFPSSRCRCQQTPTNSYHTLSPTSPSSSNHDASSTARQGYNIDSPQHNLPPTSSSAAGSAARSSPTWKDGRTRTLVDPMQPTREFASVYLPQLSYTPPSNSGFSMHPPAGSGGQRGTMTVHEGTYPSVSLDRETPTPCRVGVTYDFHPLAHLTAAVSTRNQRSPPSSSGVTTLSPPPTSTFSSPRTAQPAGAPPPPHYPRVTPSSASSPGNAPRSTADASRHQDLRRIGRWLSQHQYLNTGQEPIIGKDYCPLEAEPLGMKGKTIFTAFFDHTEGKTLTCHVCPHVSYNLGDAIIHQRGARHYQD